MEIKTDDPEVMEEIMHGFEELWPKIIFYDPDIEKWHGLLQNVYAQGALNTFQYIRERMAEDKAPDVTVH